MKKYLQYRRGYICIWLLLCIAPILIQMLYGQALESVLYGIGLATVLVLFFMVHDFLRFREKEEKRKQIAQNMGSRELCLFDTKNPVEKEYLDLLSELTERYCKQAEQMQNATKERQEYYTTWVHQVKTPMAAMNMLLQKEDTPESRQLQLQLFRMEEYVEMILHFTRLEESGTDFVFDAYDLDEMIRKTIRKYASVFVQKKIAICYDTVSTHVLTDEKWFCFVLEQVLSNALKYTNHGSVTIAMETPGLLTIRDTGIGIASEDVPRVFEKGYTGYNGRADHKSTGLGLYLCKRTMDRLHHGISLTSTVGEGTTVTLDLRREERVIE